MTWVDDLSERDLSKSQLASLRRLEKKASISMALEMDDALAESLERILQAILELHAVLAGLPAPVVNVAPPAITVSPAEVYVPEVDLSSIVTAVTGLKPGADASDIAEAIVNRLQLPSVPDSSGPLAEVAAALEKLEFRMRGMGTQAYGGGSVTLLPNQTVGVSGLPNLTGAWSYYAGTSGTVNVAAGQRVIGIAAHATGAGSMTIAGGASITIPAGLAYSFTPNGNLVAPQVVFTGTDTYVIEVLT